MVNSAGWIDLIDELKLRRWARENFVPQEQRSDRWHPIIHDEMRAKERDPVPTAKAPAESARV